MPTNGGHDLILEMSLGGDGTPCPPPGKVQNCSMAQHSDDGGRTWRPFHDWSRVGANEILSLPNGSFTTLPYSTTVDYSTNLSATSVTG